MKKYTKRTFVILLKDGETAILVKGFIRLTRKLETLNNIERIYVLYDKNKYKVFL